MQKLWWLIGVALVACLGGLGCDTAKVVGPTSDSNFVRLPEVANVAITLDFQTGAVTVIDRDDRGVGVQIEKVDSPGIIFSDAWIDKYEPSTRLSHFEHGWRVRITVVIYQSWVVAISPIINALGEDFLGKLQEAWIYRRVSETVIIP